MPRKYSVNCRAVFERFLLGSPITSDPCVLSWYCLEILEQRLPRLPNISGGPTNYSGDIKSMDDLLKTQLQEYIVKIAKRIARDVTTAYEFDAQCAGVVTAVRTALTTVKNSWNDSSLVSTWRLPPELLEDCFSWLNLADRVRASGVCATWRAIALAQPRLWNELDMRLPCARDVSLFHTLVARTNVLPLHLTIHMDGPSDDDLLQFIYGDVIQFIYGESNRIQSLKINKSRIYLERLQTAQLALLDVQEVSIIGVTQPFYSLVSFTVRGLYDRDDNLRSLFTICPNLVSLELGGWCDSSSLPRAPIPRSLIYVALHLRNALTYYLEPWGHHQLHTFSVMGNENIRSALNYVMNTNLAVKELELGNEEIHIRDAPDGKHVVSVIECTFGEERVLSQWVDILRPRLNGLRWLLFAGPFYELADANLDLPGLEELVIEDPVYWAPRTQDGGEELLIPALRTLTVRVKFDNGLFHHFLINLPLLWKTFVRPDNLRAKVLVIDIKLHPEYKDEGLSKMDFSGVADEWYANV